MLSYRSRKVVFYKVKMPLAFGVFTQKCLFREHGQIAIRPSVLSMLFTEIMGNGKQYSSRS